MPGRAQTGRPDAVVRPAARRAGDRGRAAARLAPRSRRACLGDRRRSDRGRACQGHHVHGLRHGRLEARRTGAAEEGESRARQLDAAAQAMAANAFSFAGQSCISVQRIYVEAPAYDSFLEHFLPKVEALKVGDPADEETDVGPVIDDDARERILAWIEEARSSGARVLTGGDTDGELIRPTVIADAGPELRVNCEEVF